METRKVSELETDAHREVAFHAMRTEKLLRPKCAQAFKRAGGGGLASNALIAGLQNILAEQMAIHAVAGGFDEAEQMKLFEVTTAALFQNYTRHVLDKTETVAEHFGAQAAQATQQ